MAVSSVYILGRLGDVVWGSGFFPPPSQLHCQLPEFYPGLTQEDRCWDWTKNPGVESEFCPLMGDLM